MSRSVIFLSCLFFSVHSIAFFLGILPQAHANDELPNDYSSVEERRIHVLIKEERANIQRDKKVLKLREKELKTLEASVDKKIEVIDRKLDELKGLQKKIESLLADKSNEEKKRLKELSAIYEKMDSGRAALAISGMNQQLATDLLAKMKPKAAAKILNMLDKQKTSQLSTSFTTIQLE